MLYPSNFEQKLGFDQIREMIVNRCLSNLGIDLVEKISFSTNQDEISEMLTLTAEMKTIQQFEENFPTQDYYDLIPELLRIRIPGTYMEPEQLSELKLSMQTIQSVLVFIGLRKEKYPCLYAGCRMHDTGYDMDNPASCILDLASVIKKVETLINDKSQVRDNASPALLKIRREKTAKQNSVERMVIQSFKEAKKSGWTPDDTDITIRNGRLVIPLVSNHKRKIPGFLHDESATGQTVYIEPAGSFEVNNEIRELEYAERREIIRILTAFADSLRPDIEELIKNYHFLGEIDFLRAKAMFAIEIGGMKPSSVKGWEMGDPQSPIPYPLSLTWHHAIHPLLYLSHKSQKKKVVPLDISLDGEQRILVISGPNAGGKSVCLKTVGLVQYMYQCGLLPPVKEDSEFCIFRNIFIDIGDEQSIDNDLSTYTSKLLNLKFFIENVDEQSLFLIDEMGTGTDPSLGGPIAEATLESLNAKGSYGLVTTHYSNLKLLAGRESGIFNGAMLFDAKKLKPLYQLKTGKPGSSFAFEIAHEVGFPEEVLDNARKKTGVSQLDFDRELQNLEVEKQEINKKESELGVADEFLAETIRKYQKLKDDLEKSKKEILENARNEARQLLDESNKLIERTVKEIKESQADKVKTKEVRRDLDKMKEKLTGEESGSKSQVSGSKSQVSGSKSQVSGSQNPIINYQLSIINSPKSPYQGYVDDINRKLLSFELTLDLRGKRVDEAQAILQRYIDDATMLSINEVRILHGKGNGVLRLVTRDYLRSRKEVKSAKDEVLERGGAGWTVVVFR
ncbi:MAG: Smr/MutS family protein [bacterium]